MGEVMDSGIILRQARDGEILNAHIFFGTRIQGTWREQKCDFSPQQI